METYRLRFGKRHTSSRHLPRFTYAEYSRGRNDIQDIYSQIEEGTELIKHQRNNRKEHFTHKVNIKKDSKMYDIVKQEEIFTISNHHQAVNEVAPGFRVAAKTNDGIIEAIESTEHDFVIGLQWHPEERYHTDESS